MRTPAEYADLIDKMSRVSIVKIMKNAKKRLRKGKQFTALQQAIFDHERLKVVESVSAQINNNDE